MNEQGIHKIERPALRELQAPLRARYQSDPSSAVIETGARTVPSDPKDYAISRVTFLHQPHRGVEGGIHPAVGGTDELPCSGDILCAALAVCEETTIKAVANHLGLDVESISVVVVGRSDIRPVLGIEATAPCGPTGISVKSTVRFAPGTNLERAERMVQLVERYCATLKALREPQEVASSFSIQVATQ